MPTAWPGRAPPYDVAAGYHPFVDYRYVHAGQACWLDADGREPSPWEPMAGSGWLRPAHVAVPHGIRLELQPASKSEPFILGEAPWEYWLVDSVDVVIRDGGLYRLWYESKPSDLWDAERSRALPAHGSYGRVLCYAESADGVTWRKPELGLSEWNGSRANNIVLGRELTGPRGLLGTAVFRGRHGAVARTLQVHVHGRERSGREPRRAPASRHTGRPDDGATRRPARHLRGHVTRRPGLDGAPAADRLALRRHGERG